VVGACPECICENIKTKEQGSHLTFHEHDDDIKTNGTNC